jgi:tetratricopeptide (TPR) repeat protein
MLAFVLLVSRQGGWHIMEPQVTRAAALAARAVELDDSDPWAHLALGFVAVTRRRTDDAVEEFHRALDLNPNFAAAHGFLGCGLAFEARPPSILRFRFWSNFTPEEGHFARTAVSPRIALALCVSN